MFNRERNSQNAICFPFGKFLKPLILYFDWTKTKNHLWVEHELISVQVVSFVKWLLLLKTEGRQIQQFSFGISFEVCQLYLNF